MDTLTNAHDIFNKLQNFPQNIKLTIKRSFEVFRFLDILIDKENGKIIADIYNALLSVF